MRYGKFYDPYRGDGYFISFRIKPGFLLLGIRWRWNFRYADLGHKWRCYIGPLEIEKYKARPHPRQESGHG